MKVACDLEHAMNVLHLSWG